MNRAQSAVMAIILAAAGHALAVNKCTGPDGKTTYQDAPCANTSKSEALNVRNTAPSKEDQEKAQQQNRIYGAIARGAVMIGMTADQVRSSWGSPTKINSSLGTYGKHEQWIYDRGNFRSQYVYVENGVVTSIQSPE